MPWGPVYWTAPPATACGPMRMHPSGPRLHRSPSRPSARLAWPVIGPCPRETGTEHQRHVVPGWRRHVPGCLGSVGWRHWRRCQDADAGRRRKDARRGEKKEAAIGRPPTLIFLCCSCFGGFPKHLAPPVSLRRTRAIEERRSIGPWESLHKSQCNLTLHSHNARRVCAMPPAAFPWRRRTARLRSSRSTPLSMTVRAGPSG